MEGGALNTWGMEIVNGDFDSYEWDAVAEEGYEHAEIENIEASHTIYPQIPDGMSAQDARMILESRDFTIPLRKALVDHTWIKAMTKDDDRHYPNFRVYTEELRTQDETNIKLVITFEADVNSSDAQVNTMKDVLDVWWEEEPLIEAVQKVFNQVVEENTADDAALAAASEKRDQALAQKEKESSQEVTNESIVRGWKNFLHS